MLDLSFYTLDELRRDEQLVLYRGQSSSVPRHVLAVAPVSERHEREAIKQLEHEYALRIELDSTWAAVPVALVRDKGRTVLVLEDPGGEPLDRLLKRPLELEQFLNIAIGLCVALRRLHAQGLVHKDVKPANVIVDAASGNVWLTGFGAASALSREPQKSGPPEAIAGTLAYMAPEQTGRLNRSVDSRSDLYSLGITLYQMLTGELPFSASDPLELIHCHLARQPMPPEAHRADVPTALSAIVLKLLAKPAEERYQTAAGLEHDLRRCLEDLQCHGRVGPFVIGARDIPDRFIVPQKLYGRDRERTVLLEAFGRVVASGTTELVLVSGQSGIGKSSLVNELYKAITGPHATMASGKFDRYKRDIPYATIAPAFQGLIRQTLSRSEAEIGRCRDAIRDAVGENGQLLVNLIPELEFLIGKQAQIEELGAQEAETRFQAVFRAFVGVFARKEHPLVLFLDDLQWLDAATLKLLEHLAVQPDIHYLLLIGAFRDNEVDPSHPLMLMLDSIRRRGAPVRDIVLAPLSSDDVGELVVDSIHQKRELIEPLAQLVHQKTAGNPFFVIQFLTALAEERLIKFDPQNAVWWWDLERIYARAITDNVIDLLIQKLNQLSDNTRETLKELACLGNRANTDTLAIVHARSEEDTYSDLKEAIQEGFVVRSSGAYEFTHDRIHEAAYFLIPEKDRAAVHLRIGRVLLAAMPAATITAHIFDLINQFNRGAVLISEPSEKACVAELNLLAGRKARASSAYAGACIYASEGMKLLRSEDWERQYELAFGLWLLRLESEFLCGSFERAESLIPELIARAISKLDKTAVYLIKIDLHTIRGEQRKAVYTSLDCLRMLGVPLNDHPTWQEVSLECEKVWLSLGERSIESLIDLEPTNDPEVQAQMRVLSRLYSSVFSIDINLYYLCICYAVNMTLKQGTSDASAHSYASFGFILGPAFHRYSDGYRFARLGVDLVAKRGLTFKAKVYMTMAWTAPWTQPIGIAIDFVRDAFRAAVETGDLTYACYCCDWVVTELLMQGSSLGQIWLESERSLDFVRKMNANEYVDRALSQQWFIQTMRANGETSVTRDLVRLDERLFEEKLSSDDPTIVCWHWILKLQARYLLGDYEAAFAARMHAQQLLSAATGCIQLLDYHYYSALTIAALFDAAPREQQAYWRTELARHVAQLGEWAANYPPTFFDKYALASAEIARIEGRDLDAMRLYEQAIESARKNGFVQHQAVACEIAGKFSLTHGLEMIGHDYLRSARFCYQKWEAQAKIAQLDRLYPHLEESVPLGTTNTTVSSIEHLDLISVTKALQAVSREINLQQLIEVLMTRALEHAGAERGLLFMIRTAALKVEAEARTVGDEVEVVFGNSLAEPPGYPEIVVRYVVRTRESIIIDDAYSANEFSDDIYFVQRRARSLFCLPLVQQSELIGVLYLENTLLPEVFTRKRLAVLELLASQAAISLKNAQLYADLQLENSERMRAEEERDKAEKELQKHTSALNQLREEVRQSSRVAMMGELTASLAHELNQPLGGILSNAQAALRFLTQKKPDLTEVKAAVKDIISDDSRAVETIQNVRALFQRNAVKMSSLDLNQTLEDAARLLAAEAMQREVVLRLNLSPSLPTVVGSRTQLLQATMNLVRNAFDAVCGGGPGSREVELRARQFRPGWVQIVVCDTGKGIDPENMPRLFDAFFTTKSHGIGMGLAIVRSIIETHGGRVWATPNPDHGASLTFELPVKGQEVIPKVSRS